MVTILVVDDDPAVLTAIQTFLNYEGFEVIIAGSAAAGLEVLKTDIVDVLVLDMFLPNMNGLDAIEAVRERAPQLPIIAITGYWFRDWREPGMDVLAKAIELGAAAVLRKPFRPTQLASAIRHCLEEVRQPQASAFGLEHQKPAVGLAVISRNLRYVRINNQLAKLNGVPQADHIGRSLSEIIPHLHEPIEETIRHVLRSGRAAEACTLVGETARAPGVKRGWLQDFFPIKTAHGTVAGVGVMVREIAVPLASQAGGKQAFATPEHLLESGKECFRMVRAEDANAVGLDRLGRRLRTRAVKRLAQIHKMRRAAGR